MAKKKSKKKARSPTKSKPAPPQSSPNFFLWALIVACVAVAVFAYKTAITDKTVMGDGKQTSSQHVEVAPQTEEEEAIEGGLSKEDRLAMQGPFRKEKNCFPNGRCVNLRPWKSKRKYVPKKGCKDKREGCPSWAKRGQCDTNPGWMIVYCPVSCKACHLLDTKKRCRRRPEQTPALAPGGIKEIYDNLEANYPELKPRVLRNNDNDDQLYFAVFENFLSDLEADTLRNWLEKLNPKRSTTQSDSWNNDGIMSQAHNSVRTSENAWCTQNCWWDPIIMGVVDRISNLTRAPARNFENFQMVRYTKGQFYRTHNDCNPKDNIDTQTAGHRIFTVFLYLNDVEEGGETDFPKLGERVNPKKGWAAFWPDVKNLNPEECELRYSHHAMDVTKGIKYGANIWVHQWDYQTSSAWGCTGSFEG